MKLSVKKFSKKSLSLLIALIMVFSTMPFTAVTAQAAVSTLYNDRHGIVTNGDQSRWKNNRFNIVNDGESNNTSAGVLHFDLTDYMNKKISKVTFNVAIESTSADTQIQYMNYYYSTTLKKDSTWLVAGGKETRNAGIGYGTGTTGVDTVLDNLGHNGGLLARTARTETSGSFDVTNTIKGLIEQGNKDLYIIVMHSNAGGTGSNSGWSDTTVNPASIYFSIDSSDYDFNSVSGNKEYIEANISKFAMPTTQTVSYYGTDLGISNVLYTSNTFVDSANSAMTDFTLNNKPDDTKVSAKLMAGVGRIVYMYTGDKTVAKIPLVYESKKNASTLQTYRYNYITSANSTWTFGNSNWIRSTARNAWDTASGSMDGAYTVSSASNHNVDDFSDSNKPSALGDASYDFHNIATYNGSVSFTNNYMKFNTTPSIDMSLDGYCSWKEGVWPFQSTKFSYLNNITKNTPGLKVAVPTLSTPNNTSYSMIDFSGYNALVSNNTMKSKYNTVKANETKYTDDSLLAYYKAVANLVKFKTSNYDLSKDSGVTSCASDLATVVSAYTTANNNLKFKTITVNFVNYNGQSVKKVVLNPGEKIGEFPANTAPTPDSSFPDKGHNVYYWNKSFTKDSVPTTDVTIDELQGTELIGHSSTTPATCISKARCSVCGAEYGSFGKHSYKLETDYQVPIDFEENMYKRSMCIYNCGTEDINGREYMDVSSYWETYDAQLTQSQAEIDNTVKYTSDSIKAVQDIIDEVAPVKDSPTKSQGYIQAKTNELATATNSLVLNKYEITFNVVNEYGNFTETVINAKSCDYGTLLNLQLPDAYQENAVSAWKRNINGADSVVGATSHSLQVMITGDATYTAFVKKATTALEGQAVITISNKSNKVYDIGYVTISNSVPVTVDVDNGTITVGGKELKAPTYSFYKVKGFKINDNTVNSGTINITGDIVIKPEYEAITSFEITGGDGVVEKSTRTSWDKRVKLTAQTRAQSGKINKWTSTIKGKTVVWGYGDTLSFQATQACTVECAEVDATEFDGAEDVKLSVDYVSYNLYRSNSITAISRVIAPEGIVEEYGTILKTANIKSGATNENYETQKAAVDNKDNYKATNKSGVFKSTQMISNTNQFAYNFYSAQNYDKMYVGAVAYAKLTNGSYVYSDVVTYEFIRQGR